MLDFNLILVTGAQGWLGSRLVETLAHGLPETPGFEAPFRAGRTRCMVMPGIDSSVLQRAHPSMEIVRGDLRSAPDCERLCAGAKGALLFHTAGIIHPGRIRELYDINTQGARNLLAAAAKAGVKRAVVVSSNSPCGCNPHPDHLFDESSPYAPYMNYGRSKMLMELAVSEFEQRGDIETVIIRPPWFYGPNQPPRQSLFFKMIREGKAPVVGSGKNLRSMGYVDNLCQGLMLAGGIDKARGQTYWIADRRPYTMNEIINTIETLLETEFGKTCKHTRMRLPGIASSVAYAADKMLQAAGLYHQKIHVLSEMNKTIACSIAKAERELGYNPRVELEEGMRRSLVWCAARGMDF